MSRHRRRGLVLTTRGVLVLSGVVGMVLVAAGVFGGRWLDQQTLWGPLAACEAEHAEPCIVTRDGMVPKSRAERVEG